MVDAVKGAVRLDNEGFDRSLWWVVALCVRREFGSERRITSPLRSLGNEERRIVASADENA